MHILFIMVLLLCMYFCRELAKKKGYNTTTAVILAAIFNIFALAGYMILPAKTDIPKGN